MKKCILILAMAASTLKAQAQPEESFTPEQKLQVLGALITSNRVGSDVKSALTHLFQDQKDEKSRDSITSFTCDYIGRSLRYACEIRLGLNITNARHDRLLIHVVGFVEPEMSVQNAKVEVLTD